MTPWQLFQYYDHTLAQARHNIFNNNSLRLHTAVQILDILHVNSEKGKSVYLPADDHSLSKIGLYNYQKLTVPRLTILNFTLPLLPLLICAVNFVITKEGRHWDRPANILNTGDQLRNRSRSLDFPTALISQAYYPAPPLSNFV